MIVRSVFVVAANTDDVRGEQQFAEEAKPNIRDILDKCDGVVKIEVYPTGKGVIVIQFETHMHVNASNAFNALVNGLMGVGYEVLAGEPRARINTGRLEVPTPKRKAAPAAEASTAKAERRLPPKLKTITVSKVVDFTGTPDQVRNRIAFVSTLSGVTVRDPAD